MADKNVLQFTELTVAPDILDMLYIGDVSEAVLDNQNKKVSPDNLIKFIGTGNYTGSIVVASGQTLTVASDTESVAILGRAKVGYDGASADVAIFSHFDHASATNFGLSQDANGATIVNAATGQAISFAINDAAIFGLNASGLIGNAGARITQFDTNLTANSATRGVTQAAVVAGIATPTITDFSSAQHDHADAAGGGNTLVVPTIASFANAGHTHLDAAGGGTIDKISEGNSSVEVVDAGSGQVTITVDGIGLVETFLSGNIGGINIYEGTGTSTFAIRANGTTTDVTLSNNQTSGRIQLFGNDSGPVQRNLATFDPDGAASFYHAGTLTFDTTATGATIKADTDSIFVIGRGQLGYDGTNSDEFAIAHYDRMSGTDYAFKQLATGQTVINAVTGTNISIRINNSSIGNFGANNLTLTGIGIIADTDADQDFTFGKGKFGYNGADADILTIAHFDQFSATGFAIQQNASGATIVNAASGQSVVVAINDSAIMTVNASGLTVSAGVISARADADTEHILGKAKVGYNGTDADVAVFAHYDQMGSAGFALAQNASGATILNAAAGQGITLSVNDTAVFGINASGLIGSSGARITAFLDEDDMSSDSATAGVTQQSTKAYVDNRVRVVTLEAFAPTAAVSTGDGKVAFVVPAEFNGKVVTAVICGVYDKGITGTTDVVIRRRRAGVDADVLSTAVTIGDEWYAADGVIDAANDDLATGDTITVDVDAVHSGTAPNGLTITLEIT